MTVINTNIPAAIAHNAIRLNTRAMDQAMERLSTGKRLNSGADDPGGIGVSARLEAASRGHRQGVRNVNDAISMLQTYSSAGQSILNMVIRMKELAVQGSSTLTSTEDRFAMDSEYNQLGLEWARIAANTSWNGDTGMADFNNGGAGWTIRVDGGSVAATSSITISLKNWTPTHSSGNALESVTKATAAAAADNNASNVQAYNFTRNAANPPISHDHIQSVAASTAAVRKLEEAIEGMSAELALHGALTNRLNRAMDNLSEVATSLEKSQSQVVDADYAKETTELSRTQIIAQAATAMLAQANVAPQTILALLQ